MAFGYERSKRFSASQSGTTIQGNVWLGSLKSRQIVVIMYKSSASSDHQQFGGVSLSDISVNVHHQFGYEFSTTSVGITSMFKLAIGR